MEIVFTTKSGKEFRIIAFESIDRAMDDVRNAIIVAHKLDDPIVDIYNDFLTAPTRNRPLALGWKYENGKYILQEG